MYVFQSIDEKATAKAIRETGNPEALELLAKRRIKAAAVAAGVELVYHERWRYQLIDHKGHKRTFTGSTTEKKTIAMAEARRIRVREIREGTRPAPKASDTPREFKATAEEYVAWGRSCGGRRGFGWSEQHVKQREQNLAWWRERLNLETLGDIGLVPVEKTLLELTKTLHNKTVQGYAESIKAFCIWCVKRQYLDGDPLHGLGRRDTTPTTPHRPLTVAEVQSIMEKAPPVRQLLYKTALATGYRMNELRALTVGSIDPFGPALTLPAKDTKSRKPARQFITADLLKELTATAGDRDKAEALLHVPEKHTCRENFYRDCRKAEIPKVDGDGLTFHSLRVTYIQTIVEAGADVKTIMEAARHGSAQMSMQTYAKPNPDRLRRLAESTQKALSETRSGIAVAQREGTNDKDVSEPKEKAVVCESKEWYALQDLNLSNAHIEGADSTEGKPTLQVQVHGGGEEPTNGTPCGCEPAGTAENAREHSSGTTASELSPDLQELAGMWDRLPEAIRAGMLATARAVASMPGDSSHTIERTQRKDGEDAGRA